MKLTAKTLNDASRFVDSTVSPTGLPQGNVQSVAGQIIRGGLTAVGTVFFGLMVYAGYLWMTARGNEEQITKAKSIVIASIIGISVIVAAYAITNFVTTAALRSGGQDSAAELRE